MAKNKSRNGFGKNGTGNKVSGSKGAGGKGAGPQGPIDIITTVSDEMFDELMTLVGEKVLNFTVWDESLADALAGEETAADEQAVADIDLYLEGGVYFELYGAALYSVPTEPPVAGLATMQQELSTLINAGLFLEEFAFDEEEQLVLVLKQKNQSPFYIVVGGWTMDEWDELPE